MYQHREYSYDMSRSEPYPSNYSRNPRDTDYTRTRRFQQSDYYNNNNGYIQNFYNSRYSQYDRYSGTQSSRMLPTKEINRSDRWDRSGEKTTKVNMNNNEGNTLEDKSNVKVNTNNTATSLSDNIAQKSGDNQLSQVQAGVRVTKCPIKLESSSIFYSNGSDSIWLKIEKLDKRHICYDCQKEKWRDRVTPLCKECYRNLVKTSGDTSGKKECVHCKVEFLQHRILRKAYHVFKKVVCMDCCKNLCTYNTDPVRCHFCDCWSVWNSRSLCDRCTTNRESYGEPLPCDMCRRSCAFDRGADIRQKVDGRLLCFLCTMKYKKLKHQEEKKTLSTYRKAERSISHQRISDETSLTNSSVDYNNQSKDTDDKVDWKIIAQEKEKLYEKAKQHVTELQNRELSMKVETGSIITQLKEEKKILEKDKAQLENRILSLNAQINDWELKLKTICDEKDKVIRNIKQEKKQLIGEMEGLIRQIKLKNEDLIKQNDDLVREVNELKGKIE
ncbi:hypothetical protein cand_003070 [Cryptosporidium andersoni]|uniref:Uncharacterized protein n=1 Tax=Cryptosporidium andersoni TaxID=117008 RepID=A0A1J4MGZ3_9CRYT|nr:hypothetical protein cand_003070 [Cryptosporidium andersoni]